MRMQLIGVRSVAFRGGHPSRGHWRLNSGDRIEVLKTGNRGVITGFQVFEGQVFIQVRLERAFLDERTYFADDLRKLSLLELIAEAAE